ncbi:uncharacterized protein AB675_6985 [Cyphellophora attinorum]|uniref:F-box domain-containing protein n=1 Tax=Cyphellophora attinorum TaxID=1664694 RepID=A0A0N0NQ10_9EURO|nr:uncharacterized protein AB675_6985 [Phialophora attinorum]KPI43381.1 hypothetical protein AB675_6985 [Phialophora attinorum]
MSSVNDSSPYDSDDFDEDGVDDDGVDENSIESDPDDGLTTFRYKDLPTEVRTMILAHLVPQGGRCALDPTNIKRPGAFVDTGGDRGIMRYLLVSKAFHDGLVPILYRANEFCLIEPLSHHDSLTKIGPLALQSISHLTVKVARGMEDLGKIWETVVNTCHALETLTLVFYHEIKYWMRVLADLIVASDPKPKIDVLLYSSIWAAQDTKHTKIKADMEASLAAAGRRTMFMQYKPLPAKIKTLRISASTCDAAAYGLLTTKFKDRTVFQINAGQESELYSHLTCKKI